MPAPTNLVTIRPGVILAQPAADSFVRLERDLGHEVDVNSSYRDWLAQAKLRANWLAFAKDPAAWRRAHPGQDDPPFALPPDESMHCKGLAVDSDDPHNSRAFVKKAAEHGWIQTALARGEWWHLDYIPSRDQHRNDPAGGETPLPTPTTPTDPEEDDMARNSGIQWTRTSDKKLISAVLNADSGFYNEWQSSNADYNKGVFQAFDVPYYRTVTEIQARGIKRDLEKVRTGTA